MYYTYLAATMASAGVVGAILALGREGTRSFQKTGGGGEDGQPMMSDLVFRLVTGAAVACVVLQGAMVTRLARRVIQPESGWDKR
ncbi:hypothetical protein BCR44DRAFT_1438373 [Catenaria anguillulae PL171]|uniref:Uncharacterized protein n=1 Tax=Catenaria anguillulae PL171 TaxID=765915 RepID=A0A1Y2HFR8_9FUNG|nr:hypothetical protein BCR44DRAFT_1438373 [Catenaria anguillulae PL171]